MNLGSGSMKFLKGLLVTICVTCATVFFMSFVFLYSASKMLSKNNITKIVKEVDVEEFVDDSMSNINVSLDEIGLPEEYAKKMLKNEKLQNLVGEYVTNIFNSILIDEKLEKINPEELSSTLKESVDIVIAEAKKDGVTNINENDVQKIYQTIDDNAQLVADVVEENIDEINEEFQNNGNELINIVKTIYRVKYLFLIGFVIFLLLACLLKIKEHKYIKFLRNISFTYGTILLLFCLFINVFGNLVNGSEIKTIVDVCIGTLNYVLIIIGLILVIIGIILIVINNILKKKVVLETGTSE